MKSSTTNPWAPLLLIGAMCSICVGATLAKDLFTVFGAAGTTVLRITIAAAVAVLLARSWRTKLDRNQWLLIALYGSCLGLMNMIFYQSIARIPIGVAIAIEFLGPLSVSLYYSRSRFDFLWIFLALTGVVLVLPLGATSSQLDPLGVLYALIAAVFWATYIVIGKRASQVARPGIVSSLGLMFGALATLPFGITAAAGILERPDLIVAAIAVGLLSSAIPYSLEMRALSGMDSKSFGILLSLEPAIGALSAFLFIGEMLTLVQLIAILCVIAASVGSTWSSRPKSVNVDTSVNNL